MMMTTTNSDDNDDVYNNSDDDDDDSDDDDDMHVTMTTFSRCVWFFFDRQFGHIVVKDNSVQSPAFVSSCDLLPHSGEESLRVEEACHPENVRPTFKKPAVQLRVAVEKIREPESESCRLPRNLKVCVRNFKMRVADVRMWKS